MLLAASNCGGGGEGDHTLCCLPLQVRLHDAVAVRITPISPKPGHTDWRPWHGQPLYERHEEDEQWIPRLEAAAGLRRDQLPV